MRMEILAEMKHTREQDRQNCSNSTILLIDTSPLSPTFVENSSHCWPSIYDQCIILYICLKNTRLWSQNTPVPTRFLQVNVFCSGKWPHLHWLSMSSCRQTPEANHLQIPARRHRCAIRETISSVQFSGSVLSNFLWPHGLQHSRPSCPSPTVRLCSNTCPLSWWCHPNISSSVVPFSSCLQSFPASGSFQVSQFFALGGQSIGVSASASVLPMNIQDCFPLGWTGWISLLSKGLSSVSSNITVQRERPYTLCL